MTSPDTEFISILGASGSPEAPSRVSARSLPEVLPILGLSDIVIFPGMVAPLLVETAQSTKLIDDVVGGDRLLGVVLQRNAEAENPNLCHAARDGNPAIVLISRHAMCDKRRAAPEGRHPGAALACDWPC